MIPSSPPSATPLLPRLQSLCEHLNHDCQSLRVEINQLKTEADRLRKQLSLHDDHERDTQIALVQCIATLEGCQTGTKWWGTKYERLLREWGREDRGLLLAVRRGNRASGVVCRGRYEVEREVKDVFSWSNVFRESEGEVSVSEAQRLYQRCVRCNPLDRWMEGQYTEEALQQMHAVRGVLWEGKESGVEVCPVCAGPIRLFPTSRESFRGLRLALSRVADGREEEVGTEVCVGACLVGRGVVVDDVACQRDEADGEEEDVSCQGDETVGEEYVPPTNEIVREQFYFGTEEPDMVSVQSHKGFSVEELRLFHYLHDVDGVPGSSEGGEERLPYSRFLSCLSHRWRPELIPRTRGWTVPSSFDVVFDEDQEPEKGVSICFSHCFKAFSFEEMRLVDCGY